MWLVTTPPYELGTHYCGFLIDGVGSALKAHYHDPAALWSTEWLAQGSSPRLATVELSLPSAADTERFALSGLDPGLANVVEQIAVLASKL